MQQLRGTSAGLQAARERLLKEVVGEDVHKRPLLVVGRTAMSALNVLVIVRARLPHVDELADHLSCVARMNTVVTSRCREEDGRVVHTGARCVVRRIVLKIGPVVCVWVAVLSDPGGASQELVIPAHVEEWHLATGQR